MTQYYSRIDTEFNGDVYSIPFSYINENEINVYINDELWEDWEFLNASQIKLLELPSDLPANSIITIQRNTNIEEKVVDFTNNTMLSESALDLSNDQFLYSIQEVYDDVSKFKIDVKEEVDKKVEAVSEAASKINALEEAVVTATDAAQVASEQAEIAVEVSTEAKELLNSSLEEIQEESIQAITSINQEAQKIIDTGIDNRATIDLDNITDKAKQDIQYQAKLANAPFCANSGNVDENGNADLLYLPTNTETIEIPWQNPTLTTLTDYGTVTGDGFTNLLTLFDGSTALQGISIHTSNLYWSFPKDKKIFLNKISIYFGDQGSVSGSAYNASLNLYKNDELVKTVTVNVGASFAYRITEFEKTECDRIHLYIDGYNHNTVPTRIGEIIFSGTEIVDLKTNDSCYFKVGGDYTNLIATNTEKTFDKTYLKPINLNDYPFEYVPNYLINGTITDNKGIINGFSASNYIMLPEQIALDSATWEVFLKFKAPSTLTTTGVIIGDILHGDDNLAIFHQNAIVYLMAMGNQIDTTYSLSADTTYEIKCVRENSLITVFIKQDTEEEYTQIAQTEAIDIEPTTYSLGIDMDGGFFGGSIDLNSCYIKKDNQIVWNCFGAKNGTYNVFVSETKDTYMLANTIYRQKSEPKPKFVQPILTENGVMGGDSFAVSSNVEAVENSAGQAFNGLTTNYFHTLSGTKTGYFDIYNPIALNITALEFYNQNNAANRASSAGIIYGSNDGADWVQITTYTNTIQTAGSSWKIDLSSNTNYYKYYRIESTAGGSDSYWCIAIINITATEMLAPIDTVWLDTSVQPYKAYRFNGSEWEKFIDVPIGSLVVERKIITRVGTFPYNYTQRVESISWAIPDYTKAIDISAFKSASSQYECPCNGVIIACIGGDASNIASGVYINDVQVSGSNISTAYWTSHTIIVEKGDKVYCSSNNGNLSHFYPMKGAI